MLGEVFRKCGVPVNFSLDADNDDTLYSHAYHRNAAILSGDRDMLRYINPRGQLRIFSSCSMKDGEVKLESQKETHSSSSPRQILTPPPKTCSHDPSFVRVKEDKLYRRGTPSPLTRYFGNFHETVRPLREALYSKLGFPAEIKEIYPVWDESGRQVLWREGITSGNPLLLALLSEEKAIEAFKYFFNIETLQKDSKNFTNIVWHNHVYSMWASVFELISFACGIPLIDLLTNCRDFKSSLKNALKSSSAEKPTRITGRTLPCSDCRNDFFFSQTEECYFVERGFSLPKRCQPCRNARRLAGQFQRLKST